MIFYSDLDADLRSSTTFSHPNIETTDRVLGGEEQGYSYACYDNPTVRAFEEALMALETMETEAGAFCILLGMAATHAALVAAGGADGRGHGPRSRPSTLRLDGDAARPGLRGERRRNSLRRRV